MTSCRFSRWRISAILDFRGSIMGSMKSPCMTSYKSSIVLALSALSPAGYDHISAAVSSSCVLADTCLLWPSATVAYRRVQCSARCCSLPTCQLLASWSSRTTCHTTSSPMTRSSSSAWTVPTPRQLSTGSLTAPPQLASGSCRTASNSTLTSERWSFSAPLLSSGQLPTSPPSMLPEALCRSHRSSSRLVWPLIPTCGSTVTREMLQRPATSTLALCTTYAVYWLTTSPRQSRAASSLPGWTTAMHCWVAHWRQLSISYSAPRTTWPESSAKAGVAPTLGHCFTRYTGFQWGSGSPINWLYWLKVRTTATPTYLSELVQTRAPPRALRSCDARRSSHTHRTGPSCFFCCCSIHLELSTCWHSTVRKHSHFQTPLENPSIQTHLVLLCCIKRLCIFGPKGAIQIRYYYYYY